MNAPFAFFSTVAVALSIALMLPAAASAESAFQNEADFLARVGAEWTSIAEGVYQRQLADGQTIEHGFGRAGMMYLLESTRDQKAALLERAEKSHSASVQHALAELDRTLAGLEAALAAAGDEADRAETKSSCPPVTISAQVSCSPTTGFGSSSVFFADFGPCNQAVGSVQAFGSPGTQDYWSGSIFCYSPKSASATCTVGQEGCFIYAFAEIDFTSCSDYQFRRATQYCEGAGFGL
ncbi:MAG: hypothetical protein AAGN46_13000 [Acidobacteriota bacterium]